jgi:hypothetical protein
MHVCLTFVSYFLLPAVMLEEKKYNEILQLCFNQLGSFNLFIFR